jgi:methionine-S-sulfoxide reductase
VLRTRVGYAGGQKEHPTYDDLGNHTEVISIDYDPAVLSYSDLLKIFWEAHRCDQLNRSRQYMNAVFYHSDEQKKLAEESRAAAAKAQGVKAEEVETSIFPVGPFTYAEAYHQKYYLTRYPGIRGVLTRAYPEAKALADSAVATRLNAYLGSGMNRDWTLFVKELPEYGLPAELEKALSEAALDLIAQKSRGTEKTRD